MTRPRPRTAPPRAGEKSFERRAAFWAGLLVATALCAGIAACDGGEGSGAPRPDASDRLASRSPGIAAPTRVWALLINGGGRASRNYQSHLLHVREIVDLLRASGVPRDQIEIFSSDGSDPEPDLAVRDLQAGRELWLIEGLRVGRDLAPEIRYENSEVGDMALRPATRQALWSWLEHESSRLRPGDTLLVYVTDHGVRNQRNLENNAIQLWGERLSVRELRSFIDALPEGVRVVSLMSQCYSGSFANAIYRTDAPERTSGQVCGYYSSSAERRAYGCYPENRGKENIGHSFRFIEALRIHRSFLPAHAHVLLTDRTPDVPHRSSDQYAQRLLEQAALEREISFSELVDELLREAWRDVDRHAEQFDQLERLGRAFGSFGPRSLSELELTSREIEQLAREFESYARRWKAVFDEAKRVHFQRFLQAHPEWAPRVDSAALAALDWVEKRRLSGELIDALSAFTDAEPAIRERLESLRTIHEAADAGGYRMEVRAAVLLRMRSLLVRSAGLVFLERYASAPVRSDFDALNACEDLSVGEAQAEAAEVSQTLPEPFPPLVEELERLDAVVPGWIGLEYGVVPGPFQRSLGLEPGAVRVLRTAPGSPAEAAGLRPQDIVIGPPGRPFVEPNQIREWVASSAPGEVRSLEIVRRQTRRRVEIAAERPPLDE
jgi:hypothetical protein